MTESLTPTLRALLDRATKRPWTHTPSGEDYPASVETDPDLKFIAEFRRSGQGSANAELVAFLVNNAESLLSAAEAAQSARADALEEAARWHDAEIAKIEEQIVANNEYRQRSESKRTCDAANEYCRDCIRHHQISASAIRALGKETGQ